MDITKINKESKKWRFDRLIVIMILELTLGTETIIIPSTYAGDTVELFMAFVSEDGKTVSNSVYLGSGTAS